MDKYSSLPVQRSISPYPTYAKFKDQPDLALQRKNQSFNNISSVTEHPNTDSKSTKQTNSTQQYRPSNFLAEPVSEWEEKRKKMNEEYNSYVHDEFKKRVKNRQKVNQSPEPQGKGRQLEGPQTESKEMRNEKYRQNNLAVKDFDVYRPVIRNERIDKFQTGGEIEGGVNESKGDMYYDKPKYDWSRPEIPYHSNQQYKQQSFAYRDPFRDPYRELPPFRSELSYFQELSRQRLNEPIREPIREHIREPIRESTKEPIRESTKEPIRESIKEAAFVDHLDISYTSPIIRTKYHSSMEYNDVEKLRIDQQKAFYQDLERQLQEKRQREEEEKRIQIENERKEEEKVRKEREELKKKFRSELKKEHPNLTFEETHRKPPEIDIKPPNQAGRKQPLKPISKLQPTVSTQSEKPELGGLNQEPKLTDNQSFDTKLGLLNEHAGLRYLIDQLKREASDAIADKEHAQRELARLKEDMKTKVQVEPTYTIPEGYNYRTNYYRPLNQIDVSFIPYPEKQLNNDRRFLSFAGKSIISPPALSSGYYPAKTYLEKPYESILYKPVSSTKLDIQSTTSFEYLSKDPSSSLFLTQNNESFYQDSKLDIIQEGTKEVSFPQLDAQSHKSSAFSIESSSPEVSRQSSQLLSNPDSEFEAKFLVVSAV